MAQATAVDTTPPPEDTQVEGRGENQDLLGAASLRATASLRLAHLLAGSFAGGALLAGALATPGAYLAGVEQSATP